MTINRLILGDNLEILKSMESDSIDLVYLDPPFFSNRNYEVIWGDTGEIRSFQDRWAGGISHYIVPIAVKPAIGVHISELEKDGGCRKIEFAAQGQSPAGIEFYSWDFAFDKEKGFKPSVIIDKEGKQALTLKAGTHTIAVKVVDNDGLENTEVVALKINGVVEKG